MYVAPVGKYILGKSNSHGARHVCRAVEAPHQDMAQGQAANEEAQLALWCLVDLAGVQGQQTLHTHVNRLPPVQPEECTARIAT